MPLRDVAIVGACATRQARSLERTSMDVTLEAVLGALDDAGIGPAEVDGAALEWPGVGGGAAGDASSWARLLGGPLRWTSDGVLDTAGIRGVAKAAAAISAGLCETVVLGGGAAGMGLQRRELRQFSAPWGASAVPVFALVAQRHMFEFGTTPEQLALVAATIRNAGHANPEAVMYGRGPYTVDDVLASPMVATPFHLLDVCLVNQGGAALVLTTAERAKDLRQPPVLVLGAGSEIAQGAYVNPPLYAEVGRLGHRTAGRVFAMAGVPVHDVDVFCLYDPNSFEVIRQFEVLGLCAEGEGGPFVEGNSVAVDGKYPTNPDGGLLSYSWCYVQQLTLKVVECVKQLRGQAGNRQVPGAKIAVATGGGSGAHHWEMAVFGRA